MKESTKIGLVSVAALGGIILLGWILTANDLAMRKVFAPAQEQVRRETFEQSKAYKTGMVQELENMRFEYIKADPAHKAALASLIRHRAAGVPREDLPPSLYSFIQELP